MQLLSTNQQKDAEKKVSSLAKTPAAVAAASSFHGTTSSHLFSSPPKSSNLNNQTKSLRTDVHLLVVLTAADMLDPLGI